MASVDASEQRDGSPVSTRTPTSPSTEGEEPNFDESPVGRFKAHIWDKLLPAMKPKDYAFFAPAVTEECGEVAEKVAKLEELKASRDQAIARMNRVAFLLALLAFPLTFVLFVVLVFGYQVYMMKNLAITCSFFALWVFLACCFDLWQRSKLKEERQVQVKDAELEIAKEIGDVMFYITTVSFKAESQAPHLRMPEEWPEAGEQLAAATYNCLRLFDATAKLNGRVFKAGRGDKPLEVFGPALKEHRDAILQTLADIASASGGYTLQKCADINVQKLTKRKADGTLRGDGDNR